MLTVLLGGARSGKSLLAIEIAGNYAVPVVYVATAEPRDADITERIARHRRERPDTWQTIEEPIELGAAISKVPAESVVVIDCLTLWVANLFDRDFEEVAIVERAAAIAKIAHSRSGPTIVVSNEVGSGIVPAREIARRYRDTLGRVNAAFATAADRAFLVVAGRVLELGQVDAAPKIVGR
jgi:adenosyl cobinamide kinase/adenosyl cobinamide phosphate guanylyltransferase